MANSPLFSTYRGGENRVTSSMMAVFQRLELSLLERLLGAVAQESALQLVAFANQPAGAGASVPDARMSAQFDYWFETKTVPNALGPKQLTEHYKNLTPGAKHERLFIVTPDPERPTHSTPLVTSESSGSTSERCPTRSMRSSTTTRRSWGSRHASCSGSYSNSSPKTACSTSLTPSSSPPGSHGASTTNTASTSASRTDRSDPDSRIWASTPRAPSNPLWPGSSTNAPAHHLRRDHRGGAALRQSHRQQDR